MRLETSQMIAAAVGRGETRIETSYFDETIWPGQTISTSAGDGIRIVRVIQTYLGVGGLKTEIEFCKLDRLDSPRSR